MRCTQNILPLLLIHNKAGTLILIKVSRFCLCRIGEKVIAIIEINIDLLDHGIAAHHGNQLILQLVQPPFMLSRFLFHGKNLIQNRIGGDLCRHLFHALHLMIHCHGNHMESLLVQVIGLIANDSQCDR